MHVNDYAGVSAHDVSDLLEKFKELFPGPADDCAFHVKLELPDIHDGLFYFLNACGFNVKPAY